MLEYSKYSFHNILIMSYHFVMLFNTARLCPPPNAILINPHPITGSKNKLICSVLKILRDYDRLNDIITPSVDLL